jgi:hypothetical protein
MREALSDEVGLAGGEEELLLFLRCAVGGGNNLCKGRRREKRLVVMLVSTVNADVVISLSFSTSSTSGVELYGFGEEDTADPG